jgi:hypothetical protein
MGLGPFFDVEVRGDDPAWRPVRDLLAGDALAERVAWTAEALSVRAGVEVGQRVAASTFSLGLFARLVSPTIGASLQGVAGPDPDSLLWQPVDGGPLRLATDTWGEPDLGRLLDDLVEPVVARLDAEYGVSTTIGRGNVASAVHGAARMAAQADPSLTRAAGVLLRRSLDDGLLRGTADVGPPFVRRSCCLYYRLPGGGYCGDCVLAHA